MFLHVTDARYVGNYDVELTFSDGRRGVANLTDALWGPVFEPLRDPALFAQLWVDPELQTLVWPNGADLAPEYLSSLAFRDDPALQPQFRAWGYLEAPAQPDLAGSERVSGR